MHRYSPPRVLKTALAALALPALLTACGETTVPAQPQTPAGRGLALVTATGCVACHSLDGTRGIGPSWRNSYGTQRTFTDGRTAVADEAYLRRSMLEPGVDVVAGYDSIMLPAPVSEAQIADIIAFIRELGQATPQ